MVFQDATCTWNESPLRGGETETEQLHCAPFRRKGLMKNNLLFVALRKFGFWCKVPIHEVVFWCSLKGTHSILLNPFYTYKYPVY